jgi:hypothetical protein
MRPERAFSVARHGGRQHLHITGSASWLPGQKRAIVEAGKVDDGDRPDQAEVRFRWVV